MSKKSVKLDGYVWIAENGSLDYGFYFGESDEPLSFHATLKEIVRDTLNSYSLTDGKMADYHYEDAERLYASIIGAANLVKQELNRFKEHND